MGSDNQEHVEEDPLLIKAAIFYSISSTQKGLQVNFILLILKLYKYP